MPAITTRGAASAKGFGFTNGGSPITYIEDVFSTYLYTGTGATQTITNNIDLSTKGGLTWIKGRSGTTGHRLTDTARGVTKSLASETTAAQATESTGLTAFGTTGFTIGADVDYNTSAATYVSWTFRKQPKFFDVVTYTGDGTTRAITHNLGSTPGCIIVKQLSGPDNWFVYHRSLSDNSGNPYFLYLNTTAAQDTGGGAFGTPTSTTFTVRNGTTNTNSYTYVAYIYAHNAGGFGLTGADNVISCGTLTGNLAAAPDNFANLGWEPQLILFKRTNSADSWYMYDSMRGLGADSLIANGLRPDLSAAEAIANYVSVSATGFSMNYSNPSTIIYIAIRRGPMKVPTVGTSVFTPTLATFSGTTVTNTGYVVDMVINKNGVATTSNNFVLDRLRGSDNGANQTTIPSTSSTSAELASSGRVAFTGSVTIQNGFLQQETTANNIVWAFGRAPSFFDEVCYTGTGSNTTQTHNLGVAPELWIVKGRSGATAWTAGSTALANTEYLVLNTTAAKATDATAWNSTFPSSSVFSLGSRATVNTSAATYVAYLFATLAGISKVGSYTGNGSNQTIACGFAAGSRFVMIKRTDSTGDWYVWDSARGIAAGNDPHLSLNTTAAEVTTDDSVDTDNSGFIVNQLAATNINVTSATYIFLAIA